MQADTVVLTDPDPPVLTPEQLARDVEAIRARRQCVKCGAKWPQDGDYCRACRRLLEAESVLSGGPGGVDAPITWRDQQKVAEVQRVVPRPPGPIRTTRYFEIGKGWVEFDVLFDGT